MAQLSSLPTELLANVCRFISPTDTVRIRSTTVRLRRDIDVSLNLARIQIRNLGHSATRISVSDKAKLKGKERDSPGPLQVLSSVAIGDAPVTSELAVDMMPSPFILDTSIISDTTQACLEDQSFRTSVSSASSRNSTASDAAAAEDIVRSLLHAKRQMEGLKNLPWAGLADIYLFAAFVEFGITWDILVSIYPKFDRSMIPVERIQQISSNTTSTTAQSTSLQLLCQSHLQIRTTASTVRGDTPSFSSSRHKSHSEPVRRPGIPNETNANGNVKLVRAGTLKELSSGTLFPNEEQCLAKGRTSLPSSPHRDPKNCLEDRISNVIMEYMAWRRSPRFFNTQCAPSNMFSDAESQSLLGDRPDLRRRKSIPRLVDDTAIDSLSGTDDANMALLWACRFGREDLLSEILRLPKNLILRGNDDKEVRDITSIQEAERAASANLAVALLAEEGHAGCLRYLLDRVRVPTAYQPLNRQISSGETDATESVLQLSAARQSVGGETMSDEAGNPVITVDCSAFEHHALRMAAKNGHLEVMVVLTDKGKVDPAALGNYALRWAALNGHTEVVRFLVAQESVDPSVPNDCAIRWASRNGHSEIVQILLDVGSQESTNLANYEDEKVGRAGLTREQLDSIRRRRSVKCDPSADDNDAIRWACLEGHTEVVRCLLDSGRVDPSAEKSEALRWACRNGHKGIVQLLLATGKVDVSAEDYEALKWAARNGHSEMVELLLGDTNVIENNVDANDLDSDGVAKDRMKRRMPKHVLAALQMSLQRGHMEVAKVILDAHSSS